MAALTPMQLMMDPFNSCQSSESATQWQKFKKRFLQFITAYYEEIAENRKIAMLLHAGGDDLNCIYDSFSEKPEDLAGVLHCFDDHFIPRKNLTYERFKFLNRKQYENENFEQYAVVLKNLAEPCEFGNLKEDLIKDIFVSGINSKNLQQKLLTTNNLNLQSALDICRTASVIAVRVEEMINIKEENLTDNIKKEVEIDILKKNYVPNKKKILKKCFYCNFEHLYGKCPAFGKQCNKCKKFNHFASACRTVNCVQLGEGEEEIADSLSRDFTHKSCDTEKRDFDEDLELQVALLNKQMIVNQRDLSTFRDSYKHDVILEKVKKFVLTGWPRYYKDLDEEVKPYYNFKNKVMFKKLPQSVWEPAVILEKGNTPRMFKIESSNGRQYNRNEFYLLHRRQGSQDAEPNQDGSEVVYDSDSNVDENKCKVLGETVVNDKESSELMPNSSDSNVDENKCKVLGETVVKEKESSELMPNVKVLRSGRVIKIPSRYLE
ncbi:hypothetical protein ACJJTC_019838 [Scirpophaga incertulas]